MIKLDTTEADGPEGLAICIAKNKRETIVVRLGEYRGNQFVDLRVAFDAGDGPQFTRKGLTIPLHRCEEVAAAILQAGAVADQGE